jgi:hypothetical protein
VKNVEPMFVRARRAATAVALAVGVLIVFATGALAATRITAPAERPYHVTIDAQGKPVAFTVAGEGFPEFTSVYIEQCNGRPPDAPNWSPAVDCDLASGQAPAIADKAGKVHFDATDASRALRPFVGPSPQGLFNCLTPGAKSPGNSLPDFRACQIRIASNPAQSTTDQVFLPIVFGSDANAAGTSANSNAPWLLLGVIAVVVIAVVGVYSWRRGSPRSRQSRPARERSSSRR